MRGVERGGILTDLRPQMTLLSRGGSLDLFAGLPGLLWWQGVGMRGVERGGHTYRFKASNDFTE